MKARVLILFVLFAGALSAQAPLAQFVGNCQFQSFTLLADSSYRGNIVSFDDRLSNGYNATQITVGDEIIDGRSLVFVIDTIHSSTFTTADISVTAVVNRGFAPFGSGQVYRPTSKNLIPASSVEQLGLSPVQKAKIDRHNVVIIDSLLSDTESAFDSDRNILRVPGAGDNIGGSTVTEWLEWWYFTAPTISLAQSPSTTVVEIGTETQYTYTATTTNTGGATLSNGSLFIVSGDELDDFAATTSGTSTIDFTPLQTPADTFDSPTYQFRATQDWVFGSESGTATSNTRTIRGVYPVFYGMVADTATAFADIYGTMNKLVETENDKTVSYTGSGLIFYCMPDTWGDTNLSSIIDPNGFNVTASFTRVTYPTVTSTGLANNYTNAGCDCYFLNTGSTVTAGSNYTFNQ